MSDNNFKAYEESILADWLRHDEWYDVDALKLICNINPERSETPEFDEFEVKSGPIVVPNYRSFTVTPKTTICLLSESNFYNLQLKRDDETLTETAKRQWIETYEDSVGMPVDIYPPLDKLDLKGLRGMISARADAYRQLFKVHRIYLSNSDHLTARRWPISYFLEWAISKGINIQWKPWAEKKGLFPNKNEIGQPAGQDHLGERKEKNYQLVIGILIDLLREVAEDEDKAIKLAKQYRKDDSIKAVIGDLYDHIPGISKSTLNDYFAAGNNEFKARISSK